MPNNPYQPKVQQKLAHARLMLGLYGECGDTLPDKQKREALLEAALLHLGVVYGLYLKELGHSQGIPSIERVHTIEQLLHEMSIQDKKDASVSELARLEGSGWLYDFLSSVKQVLYPAAVNVREVSIPRDNVIQVASSQPNEPLSHGRISELMIKIESLIERQRQSSMEY